MTGRDKPREPMSAAKRAAVMENIKKAHKAQRTYPLCNAIRRTDGGRCGNLGLENGRCRLHGGRTPKGKDWHKVNFTNPGGSVDKIPKKQADVKRRRALQSARRAAMTPEQRERHDAWHMTHKPGGVDVRRAARHATELREMLSKRADGPLVETTEAKAIQDAIDSLQRQAVELSQPTPGPDPEDVFS